MRPRPPRERSNPPPGLLALCLVAAILVATPVLITIVQAFQGGFSAARLSLGAGATRKLVLHSLEVAAAATPIAGAIGVAAAWFVERTQLPCGGSGRCCSSRR